MRCVVVLLIALQAIICGGILQSSAYNPVFEYDVPVASQPIVYASPTLHAGPYIGSYAVHTTPAVSHTFSQTQTHPVAYVKPVTVHETSGQYYTPPAASSRVEHSRLIVPQTSQIYRYPVANQQYENPPNNYQNSQFLKRNFHEQTRTDQQYYSQVNPMQYNHRKVYADEVPYTNNGEQIKLRRYRVHRPGIRKEFYDVEERVIVRPVGSALIELDPPTKKQDITDHRNSNNNNQYLMSREFNDKQYGASNDQYSNSPNNQYSSSNNNQYGASNNQYNSPNNQYGSSSNYQYGATKNQYIASNKQYGDSNSQYAYPNGYNQNGEHFSTSAPDCGNVQPTVYRYSPSATPFGNQNTQYHPAIFAATKPATSYPSTDTIPSQTYLPPAQSSSSSTNPNDYYPSTTYSSTPSLFVTPTTNRSTTTTETGTTPEQSNVYISSTTPVSVIIVDKNDENQNRTVNHGQDILYAGQRQSDEDTPDQFQNELPPRGDVSQYRAEQPDQFYHELPRSRYTNEPNHPPQVYSRSNGEPFSENHENDATFVPIEPSGHNSTNNQNHTSFENNQRLIHLYTGNGGVSEIGQTSDQSQSRYTAENNQNAQYQDVGKIRARVVSVTGIPTGMVNRRRIVVSKPVITVEEIVEPDKSTGSARNDSSRAYYVDENKENRNFYMANNDGDNNNYYFDFNGGVNYQNDKEYNQNLNTGFSDNSKDGSKNYNNDRTRVNFEEITPSQRSTGVFISTTPSTASQRIIHVQPVTQDFAQQKVVSPKIN